jgi:hypothetical protein
MQRRSLIKSGLVSSAALATGALGSPEARAAAPSLRVVSFNVLAPIWAAPIWYPPELDPALLAREYRRQRIKAFLVSEAERTDVFCLQEVNEPEFAYFSAALSAFDGALAYNDPDFWSNWLVPEIPWEPKRNRHPRQEVGHFGSQLQ